MYSPNEYVTGCDSQSHSVLGPDGVAVAVLPASVRLEGVVVAVVPASVGL